MFACAASSCKKLAERTRIQVPWDKAPIILGIRTRMIRRISMENVRVFEGNGWNFTLAPLTVFCGTNSAGKSTIFRTLPLLRQSLSLDEPRPGRLKFAGNLVDLGSYSAFVSNGDASRNFSISLEVDGQIDASTLRFLRRISEKTGSTDPERNHDGMGESPGDANSLARFSFDFIADSKESNKPRPHALLKGANFDLISQGISLLSWGVFADGSRNPGYKIRIPKNYFVEVGGHNLIDIKDSANSQDLVLPAFLVNIIPQFVLGKPKKKGKGKKSSGKKGKSPEAWTLVPLPPTMNSMINQLRTELGRVIYLGPLRAAATRYYLAGEEEAPGVDATGQFAPHILRDKWEETVLCPDPNELASPKEQKLIDALSTWLRYLRTGETNTDPSPEKDISVDVTMRVLVELNIMSSAGTGRYPLVDSGFGYSQVLPVMLQGLLAAPNSTLIVEQPELHLHPAVQVRFAEFLVALMRSEKQVILETHSEHIVNAIRVLAAEDQSGIIAAKTAICFIDGNCAPPVVHDLSLRPDGTVPNWPRSFFGEAANLAGRLLRAQRSHRNRPTPTAKSDG